MFFFRRDICGDSRELYRQVFDQVRADLALYGGHHLVSLHQRIPGKGKVEHGIDLFFGEALHPLYDGVQFPGGIGAANERSNRTTRYRSDFMTVFFKPSDHADVRQPASTPTAEHKGDRLIAH